LEKNEMRLGERIARSFLRRRHASRSLHEFLVVGFLVVGPQALTRGDEAPLARQGNPCKERAGHAQARTRAHAMVSHETMRMHSAAR